jgi:hypothetical protein
MKFIYMKLYSLSLWFQRAQGHQKWSLDGKVMQVFVPDCSAVFRNGSTTPNYRLLLLKVHCSLLFWPLSGSTGPSTAPGRILAATVGIWGTYLRGLLPQQPPNPFVLVFALHCWPSWAYNFPHPSHYSCIFLREKGERRSKSTILCTNQSFLFVRESIGSRSWRNLVFSSFVLPLIFPHSISCFGGIWERRTCALRVFLSLHRLHRFEFSSEIRWWKFVELITLGFLEP